MAFCRQCGKEVGNEPFCGACGTPNPTAASVGIPAASVDTASLASTSIPIGSAAAHSGTTAAIGSVAALLGTSVPATSAAGAQKQKSRRTPLLVGVALALIAALIAGALFVFLPGNQATSTFAGAKVGDHLTFGTYGGQDISWRVLAVENGRALVITDNIIDLRAYNNEYVETTWADCSLRQWLNNDFYTTAFNAGEQAAIAPTTLSNPNNSEYGTNGGADTTDKVFLLSIEEANRYFKSDSDRVAKLSMSQALLEDAAHRIDENPRYGDSYTYAEALALVKGWNGADRWWWLRSPGGDARNAADVDNDGTVYAGGLSVGSEDDGVRPALWLML